MLLSLGRTGYSGGRIGARVQQMPQIRLIGEFEMPSGAIAPAQLYAVMARRHMELYGTTSRQFAEIAVTTRRHASLNPNATMRNRSLSRIIGPRASPIRCGCWTVRWRATAVPRW